MAKTNISEQGSIAYPTKWEKLQSHRKGYGCIVLIKDVKNEEQGSNLHTEIKTCRTGIQTQALKSTLITIILYASI